MPSMGQVSGETALYNVAMHSGEVPHIRRLMTDKLQFYFATYESAKIHSS